MLHSHSRSSIQIHIYRQSGIPIPIPMGFPWVPWEPCRSKIRRKGFSYIGYQKPGTVYPTTSDWKPAQTALNED